jgi:hopene-associated glycosyltransferase HpnB
MTTIAGLALAVWLYLLAARGRFWQAGPELAPGRPREARSVAVVVPARDEAGVIEASLHSLLAQDYAGPFRVILVDDGSSDGTGDIARAIGDARLTVVQGEAPPVGWSGKLWAIAQGLAQADDDLVLLTDADIVHDKLHVATLVAQLERSGCDMVSEMVALSCASLAERALVPAFVYFFQLLYPFAWVNDPMRATAAAAGGTILVRRAALERIGGVAALRDALIDDVALARLVKRGGRIWLGHAGLARSVRAYPAFGDIFRMIERTAYVQLRFSPVLLVGTVVAMAVTFLVPPIAALFAHGAARWLGWIAWVAMASSYVPILRRYRRSLLWAPLLPLVAAFFLAATLVSAADHHLGRGVVWKRRAYQGVGA